MTAAAMSEALFDALGGGSTPAGLFGSPLPSESTDEALSALVGLARTARQRVRDTFGTDVSPDSEGISKLDTVIDGIWRQEWPGNESSAYPILVTDLGSLLAVALLALPGTQPVFRSSSELLHFSAWVLSRHAEFFPFHKIAKSLSFRFGEKATQLYAEAQRA